MRKRILVLLPLGVAGFLTYSLTQGQPFEAVKPPIDKPEVRNASDPVVPAAATQRDPGDAIPPAPARPSRDFSKLSPLQKQMLQCAQRGADWLFRMNGVKGRFLYGYLPALKTELEGDHYLRQVGAAFALARAARFLGEERYAARATQAILTLLEETTIDPNDQQVRYATLPSMMVNRLGAAGLLVSAIHELPSPQADLLEKSEQLCNFIRRQTRPDGSLNCSEDRTAENTKDDAELVNVYPGEALYGLIKSQRLNPAAWKLEIVRKAAGHYGPWWRSHKSVAFVPWQTAAYTEAYLQTKEPIFAELVFEMNDWISGLQYDQIDPRRLTWYGGFKGWADGKTLDEAPDVNSAIYTGSLAEACRVARETGDAVRHPRYSETLERGLQFLTTLQYTEGNTQHFADWYRSRLTGAFHASHQDGNLRIDYTQHAVSAQVLYLEQVAR